MKWENSPVQMCLSGDLMEPRDSDNGAPRSVFGDEMCRPTGSSDNNDSSSAALGRGFHRSDSDSVSGVDGGDSLAREVLKIIQKKFGNWKNNIEIPNQQVWGWIEEFLKMFENTTWLIGLGTAISFEDPFIKTRWRYQDLSASSYFKQFRRFIYPFQNTLEFVSLT